MLFKQPLIEEKKVFFIQNKFFNNSGFDVCGRREVAGLQSGEICVLFINIAFSSERLESSRIILIQSLDRKQNNSD